MKTLFIEARKKHFPEINISRLPKNIGLLYTIQYRDLFEKVKKELENQGKNIFVGKSSLAKGQIIGCNIQSALNIENKVDCFLLISSGKFHAFSLALQLSRILPIYIIGTGTSCSGSEVAGKIEQVPESEIESLKKKRKAALSKFIAADRVGIIVSTKPGQQNLKDALKIKKKIKKAFIFISETISIKELENFKIDSWINTACPGIVFDSPNIINLSEYSNIEKLK